MDYAKMIDHTLLRPEATKEQIRKLCMEAVEYGFCSVCVNSCYVYYCAGLLKGAGAKNSGVKDSEIKDSGVKISGDGDSGVKVCTVIGFPLGAASTAAKAAEASTALDDGADELDMVINVGMVKSGDWDYVKEDIAAVVEQAKNYSQETKVKVILETCLLNDDEIVRACTAAKEAGADFVKTSTGFSTGGATAEDVALMRKTVGDAMGVKASGGIRCLEDVKAMVRAGADRIGASAGVAIVKEQENEDKA